MYSSCDFVFRGFRSGNKRIAIPKTIAAPNINGTFTLHLQACSWPTEKKDGSSRSWFKVKFSRFLGFAGPK